MVPKQTKWHSLRSLPTVAAHPQAQVDRTSRTDCGRRWAVWRQSILSSRAWWLGWRTRLLLGFLHRRRDWRSLNKARRGLLWTKSTPRTLTWVVGHRLLCSDRWKCCSSSWPIRVAVMLTLHFSDRCLWAPSLRPQVRSGTKSDGDWRAINKSHWSTWPPPLDGRHTPCGKVSTSLTFLPSPNALVQY